MRWLALGALLGLLLAGCSGQEKQGGPVSDSCDDEPVLCDPEHYLQNHHCIASDVRPRVYAPDTPGPDSQADPWQAGDYWQYDVQADGLAFTSRLVYYEDIDFVSGAPQHYLVGSQSRDEAFDHALYSINPMLGRIHRTLYSPHESGVHADMFGFPLCEGSTWTTIFYDTTFDLRAKRATLTLPDGTQDPLGFRIEGTSGDGSTLVHTYSPAAKWFTSIELERADGFGLSMDLTQYGSGATGTYHFFRGQKDEVVDVGAIERPVPIVREDGGEGPYDALAVAIEAQRTQGNGKVEVHVRDPSGASRACVGIAGGLTPLAQGCRASPAEFELDYVAGTWTVDVVRAPGDLGTRADGEVRIVSVYDRSGTV